MIDQKIITFHTLYETMNYHETARLLNVTQPAVTQQIKALEAEYGCKLFIYNRKCLSCTSQAEMLEEYARSAVFNEKAIREQLKKRPIQKFSIGATKSIGKYMIDNLTAEFLSDGSKTAEITVDNTENLLNMLDDNKLDFAIVEGPFSKVRYGYRLFRTENLTGICSLSHSFANKSVSLDEIFLQTLISREKGSGTRDIFEEILENNSYTPEKFSRIVTVNDFSLLCRLVSLGAGISYVYSSVAKGESGISTFSIDGINPIHELNFVYLKNTKAPDLIDKFINF